jgi:hypothetical protein
VRAAIWAALVVLGTTGCGSSAASNDRASGAGNGTAGNSATAGNTATEMDDASTSFGGANGSPVDESDGGPLNTTSGLAETCSAGEVGGLVCGGICRSATFADLECQACENNCGGETPYCKQAVCLSCDQKSPQLIACSDECVDPGNDPKNCGECGNVCPTATPYCESGVCITCEESQSFQLVNCNGQCVGSDNYNCGSCGNECAEPGTFCVQRECVPCEALPGWGYCPGIGCLEMGTIRNCSACGDQCADGEICVMGQCEVPDFGP